MKHNYLLYMSWFTAFYVLFTLYRNCVSKLELYGLALVSIMFLLIPLIVKEEYLEVKE